MPPPLLLLLLPGLGAGCRVVPGQAALVYERDTIQEFPPRARSYPHSDVRGRVGAPAGIFPCVLKDGVLFVTVAAASETSEIMRALLSLGRWGAGSLGRWGAWALRRWGAGALGRCGLVLGCTRGTSSGTSSGTSRCT